jgi:hypothetical protein
MIVAIYEDVGSVQIVEEFRDRGSVAEAVAEFHSETSTSSFAGLDTGWESYTNAPDGQGWAVDLTGAPTLVTVSVPNTLLVAASAKFPDFTVTNISTWQDVDGLVTAAAGITTTWPQSRGRLIGQVLVNGAGFELRIVKSDGITETPMSETPYTHPDTNGSWVVFSHETEHAPEPSVATYKVQVRLGAAVSAQLRYLNLSISAPEQ